MKLVDKLPAVALGAAVAVAVMLMSGHWQSKSPLGLTSATKVEELQLQIEFRERVFRDSEARVRALQQLSQALAAEDSARKRGDATALRPATEGRLKAEIELAEAEKRVRQSLASLKASEDAEKILETAKSEKKTTTWSPLRMLGLATEAEVAELRRKIEEFDRALRDSEARVKAEAEGSKRAADARAAEEAARKSGDMAKIKEAQEAARRGEEEAKRQADLVRQREAAAIAAREAARKAAEDARRAAERAAEQRQKAAVAPDEFDALYQQALAMESAGNGKEAIRVYRRAARAGSGKAAKRMGDIFDCGIPGVPRDYAESLQWYETARQLGEQIETAGRRDCAAAFSAPVVPVSSLGEAENLYRQAVAMESGGNAKDAVRIYRRAARGGSGKAAKRLGDILNCGAPGVARDYAQSLLWYDTAFQLGESVPTTAKRDGGPC